MSTVRNPLAAFGRLMFRWIDWIVRKIRRIEPFTDNPDCLVRITAGRARYDFLLSNGVRLLKGDPVLELHLWNERIQQLSLEPGTLGWGRLLIRGFKSSLRMLAEFLNENPDFRVGEAMGGEFGFMLEAEGTATVFEHFGFDVKVLERPGVRMWRRSFWDNFYSFILLWTFRPDSLQGKRVRPIQRLRAWMSFEQFDRLYGEDGKLKS